MSYVYVLDYNVYFDTDDDNTLKYEFFIKLDTLQSIIDSKRMMFMNYRISAILDIPVRNYEEMLLSLNYNIKHKYVDENFLILYTTDLQDANNWKDWVESYLLAQELKK